MQPEIEILVYVLNITGVLETGPFVAMDVHVGHLISKVPVR